MSENQQAQFLTLERADLQTGLSIVEQTKLDEFIMKAAEARRFRGLPPLSGLFISSENPAFNEVVEVLQKHGLIRKAE